MPDQGAHADVELRNVEVVVFWGSTFAPRPIAPWKYTGLGHAQGGRGTD